MTTFAIILAILLLTALVCLFLIWLELRWTASVIAWETERDLLWFKVYQEGKVATAIPPHTNIVEGPGGNLMIQNAEPPGSSTLLNYATLKDMVKIMQEQEHDRKVYTERLKVALDNAAAYELITPQPSPPKVFGKRIQVPM